MRSASYLTLLAPAIVWAQPAPALRGAPNFRDIGGINTSDGKTVRSGAIFRSGELNHLTEADYQALSPLGIRYVFDLRTDKERAAAPTAWKGGAPAIVAVPVGFAAGADPADGMKQFFAQGADPAHAAAAMKAITVQIALDGAPAIGDILRRLSQGEEPAVIHCTAGKDRTGVVTASLLLILGVPEETVYEDYVRSNDAVPAVMAGLRAAAAAGTGVPSTVSSLPPETLKVLMGVDRAYLAAAFNAIDAKYGSFNAYVAQGLQLTPDEIASLKRRLLN
jgi:protein-tyrosine phosphatase